MLLEEAYKQRQEAALTKNLACHQGSVQNNQLLLNQRSPQIKSYFDFS
jgi:hypothetical protein